MNGEQMETQEARTVSVQIALTVIAAAALYVFIDVDAAKSAFYGGVVATVNGLSLLRKVSEASRAASSAPTRALAILLSGAANRFISVIVLFGLAFGVLHLQVVPALAVFAIAQLAYGWGLRNSYKELL